jgi:diguanylate cyclase (GGDEF)-like protein
MMSGEIGKLRQALRRMSIVTAISVSSSVLMTLVAMTYVFGIDPDATIPVSLVFKFGASIALVAPLLICPIVSCKISLTIAERDHAHVELRRIAETDQLTGLLNRRGFDAAAKAAISQRHSGDPPISALMIDIDFFKKINDSFGHDVGDAALVEVATILRDMAGSEGFVAGRQGGEEFIALLPGRAALEACATAERLREACTGIAIEHDGKSISMAVSIGVACQRPPVSLSELMGEADGALYRAKRTGRNRVVLHQPVVALERAA